MREYLLKHRLDISKSAEGTIIQKFCSTRSGESRIRVLGTWFEGYIYTATLGLRHGRRVQWAPGDKGQKAVWSTGYVDQYEALISELLLRREILFELGLFDVNSTGGESLSDLLKENFLAEGFVEHEFLKNIFMRCKEILDEFMLGGLSVIEEFIAEGGNFVDVLEAPIELL